MIIGATVDARADSLRFVMFVDNDAPREFRTRTTRSLPIAVERPSGATIARRAALFAGARQNTAGGTPVGRCLLSGLITAGSAMEAER